MNVDVRIVAILCPFIFSQRCSGEVMHFPGPVEVGVWMVGALGKPVRKG